MDQIKLNNMQFYGFHGLFPEENKLGQRFYVDAALFADLHQAGASDDVKDSVNYGEVFETVRRIVEGNVYRLLEALAEGIASELLATFPLINACRIEVKKPDPPIVGHYDSVTVEIYRERTT